MCNAPADQQSEKKGCPCMNHVNCWCTLHTLRYVWYSKCAATARIQLTPQQSRCHKISERQQAGSSTCDVHPHACFCECCITQTSFAALRAKTLMLRTEPGVTTVMVLNAEVAMLQKMVRKVGRQGCTCEQGEASSNASHQGGVEGIPD